MNYIFLYSINKNQKIYTDVFLQKYQYNTLQEKQIAVENDYHLCNLLDKYNTKDIIKIVSYVLNQSQKTKTDTIILSSNFILDTINTIIKI